MDWLIARQVVFDYGFRCIVVIISLLAARFLINILIRFLSNMLTKIEIEPTVYSILIDLSRFILWILILAGILNYLGLKEISLALGGSVAVLALGLSKSISSIAADLLAGIFLLADDDFNVDSRVVVKGIEGIVESLTIRKTKIRDKEGNLHIISNRDVDASILLVITQGKETVKN